MIRGLIALALGASMLHLNVARADRACATHVHNGNQSHHDMHGSVAHHGMAMNTHHAAASDAECDTPAQAECCEAVVTCSVALGLDDGVRVESTVAAHGEEIVASLQRAPASRITSPEPPPPRA